MAIFRRQAKSTPTTPPPQQHAPANAADAETRIREIGAEFLAHARRNRSGLLSRQFWSDKLMDWSMKDHDFKVQLFRFVDTFPVLRHSSDAVHEHLADYLSQPGVSLPPGMDLGLRAGGLAKGAMTRTISSQIESMAKKFIAGTDAASALPQLERLWKDGIAFSVDLLGEACVSDAEADDYRDKYLDLVANLPATVASWKPTPRLESDHLGPIERTNVSVKISSLSAREDPIDAPGAIRDVMSRLAPILECARDNNVFINFDMEQFELKDLTLDLFMHACDTLDLARADALTTANSAGGAGASGASGGGGGGVGVVLQAYLKSGDDDARRIVEWARTSNRLITVRLVKGAYWDYETIHAEQMGWPCPVWNTKPQTDACFERMTDILLDATPTSPATGGIRLAVGSHNARSIAHALAGLEQRNLPPNAIELQMLHGMADQLKAAASDMDLRIREYVPVGEMIPGMAYLVRRLLENTSNESWLKAGFLDNADTDTLLADPTTLTRRNGSTAPAKRDLCEVAAERHQLSPAIDEIDNGKPFATEPMRDFADASQRAAFAKAIAAARVPKVANDATAEDAQRAMDRAHAFFPTWRDTDPIARAKVLTRAADLLRARRDEISGIIIKENGKGWRDADADVTEAIDFLEYYARTAIPLFRRNRLGKFIGELDETWHQPRGVAAVISPWNFPLAIACGMASAALVTGNTVVLKPAEQTPGIAKLLADTLHEAGAPKDALIFLPGPGETVGAALVRDPHTAIIAFTGSKAVGLDIIQAAGVTTEQQHHVKKVVCEMGGKNAIIIDTSADLDEAVVGVRQSAFGFQGQKCSACSRVIVVDPKGAAGTHARTFTSRLVEATRSLSIGDPLLPGTDVGPVIDEAAFNSITRYIEAARADGATLELAMEPPPMPGAVTFPPSPLEGEGRESALADEQGEGQRQPRVSGTIPNHYVGPHIFSSVEDSHTIWREEIFGPVLAITTAPTFDDALALANASPYKLTGGVFSRKPEHLERAKREFRVGNLYLNRSITGALVARQPFGGFAMSGVGSKAGGADYLLQFVEPRASCENTMRRGFAPEL